MNGTTMRNTDFTGALLAYIALQPWTSENVALTDAVLIGSDVGVENGMWADTVCPDGEQSDEECTGSPRTAPALPPEVLCPDGLQRPAQELGTNLAGGFLACLDLSGMDLTGRVFEGASLWGVSLDGADLSGSTFAAAWLIGVDLTEAVVDGTDFGGSSWYSVDLRAVELGAALATGGAVRLVGANIAGMDLTPAGQTGFVFDIDRSSARDVIMTGMRIPGGANSDFTDAVLRDARLEGGWENTLLQNADLSGATLEGVRLASSSLENVDLSGSTFTGISWDNTTCPDGTLSNDNLGVCDV